MSALTPEGAATEALSIWSPEEVLARLDERWAPQLLNRFAQVTRAALEREPEATRRSGLVSIARVILRGDPQTTAALCRDTALGRWTAGMTRALARGDSLEPLLALCGRLGLGAALRSGRSIEAHVVLGSGGRARIPADGRVLQGPPGRPLRVRVVDGALMTHAKDPRRAGPFEVIDGDAEGGALPTVRPLSGGSLTDIIQPLGKGSACLSETAPELAAEVHALAPTLVAVHGAEDVSHSASLSESRNCIWLTPVSRPLVVAETLVHEASHLKFFLVEDCVPFVTLPDHPRFEVPWRSDLRPLRAVLMGLHAWVRVVSWLDTLEGGPLAQPAAQRTRVLREAIDASVAIVTGAEGLTPAGDALVEALCSRISHG